MNAGDQFRDVLNTIINAIPHILMALALLLITWIIATLIKNIITKGGKAANLPEKMAKGKMAQTEQDGEKLLEAIGKLVFFLVFLLVIPSVFQTLGMQAIAEPLTNMADSLLAFIPNILGAGLVLFIGWFIAKFVRDIVTNIAHGFGADRLPEKIGISDSKGSNQSGAPSEPKKEENKGDKPISLSQVIGNIVYVLILIPVIIAALEILQIAAITEPAIYMLNLIFGYIPNVIAGIILILIGVLIARFVGKLLHSLLAGTGIDGMLDRFNKELDMVKVPNFSLAKIISEIVKILIVLFFVVEAANVMELGVLQTIGEAILLYIPFLLGAFIILVVGLVLANFVEKFVRKYSGGSKALGKILKYMIITFAVFMTLDQLRMAQSIVNIGFIAIMAALAVAFAIAFGIGGRSFASKQLEHVDKKIHASEENDDFKASDYSVNQNDQDPDKPTGPMV